ncbi:MAG: ECF-type sigma factor [Acidobacteriaceae bacterium]|nr:ECF-type sigma factor [Acidobacteriaceae bacterium]
MAIPAHLIAMSNEGQMADDPKNVTRLLVAWRNGDQRAYEELVPLVYDELRRLAASYLRRDRPDHTLQPTALVHEAYLRLNQGAAPECENRAHFMAIAARSMRDILVEHARRRAAAKRVSPQDFAAITQVDTDLELILQIHISLDRLASQNERMAQMVELRYFGGLSIEEVALYLETSVRTVDRDLHFAKAWLGHEMGSCQAAI